MGKTELVDKAQMAGKGLCLIGADSFVGEIGIGSEENAFRIAGKKVVPDLAVLLVELIAPADKTADAGVNVQIGISVKESRESVQPQVKLVSTHDRQLRMPFQYTAQLFQKLLIGDADASLLPVFKVGVVSTAVIGGVAHPLGHMP